MWGRGFHNSMNYEPFHVMHGHSRWMGHSEEFWQNVVHCRKERQTTPLLLLWGPHEQYEKAKRYNTRRWAPPGLTMSNMLPGQLLLAPERMKWLGQSGNDIQLWMCLVMKVKSNSVKSSIASYPRMLGPWISVNWMWSSRRWQEWTSTP